MEHHFCPFQAPTSSLYSLTTGVYMDSFNTKSYAFVHNVYLYDVDDPQNKPA